MRSLGLPLLALSVSAGLTACDPCAGIARCSSGQYLAVSGQMVDQGTGRGIDGVVIDLVPAGGVRVAEDSVRVVSHDGGFWRIELSPSEPGALTADVNVAPPGEAPYRVRGLVLVTHDHGGDANLNERWVTRPYFNHFAEFYLRGSMDDRAQNVTVEFRRTGGVALRGPGISGGVYSRVTDAAGRFRLFPYADPDSVLPVSSDAVAGDLTILLGGSLGSSVIHDYVVSPTHVYRDPSPIDRYAVGPSLGYTAVVRDRVSHDSLADVGIQFERTGGIQVSPASFSARTNGQGRFDFPPLRPREAGVLDGRLIFLATPAARPETVQVRLPTFDSDIQALPPFDITVPAASPASHRSVP